jgi:tetratricopeptide (TPR) repeat protein
MNEDAQEASTNDPRLWALIERSAAALTEGRIRDAEHAQQELWAEMERCVLEDQNPDPMFVLNVCASSFEQDRAWAAAEHAYRQALDIAREHRSPIGQFFQHCYLADLYDLLGRSAEAMAHADAALQSARGDDSAMTLALAADAFAGHAIGNGRFEDALRELQRALAPQPDGESLFALMRGRLLAHSALALLRTERIEDADTAATQALTLLEPYLEMESAAGAYSALSTAREVLACTAHRRDDVETASRHWDLSIAAYRHVARLYENTDPGVDIALARHLERYAKYLGDVGHKPQQQAALAESDQLRRRWGLAKAERGPTLISRLISLFRKRRRSSK